MWVRLPLLFFFSDVRSLNVDFRARRDLREIYKLEEKLRYAWQELARTQTHLELEKKSKGSLGRGYCHGRERLLPG